MTAIEQQKPFQWTKTRNQYFGAISANLIVFGHGCVMGWVSPALMKLKSDSTPLQSGPLNNEEVSWIGSINLLAALFGSLSFGYFTSFMGCKRAILLLSIPSAIFWLLIHFGETYYHVFIGRFFAGLTGGGLQGTIILYVSEIANNDVRGSLGSLCLFLRNIGVLFGFIIGATVDYEYIPSICIFIPIIFAVVFGALPNTPQFYLHKGQNQQAERSLKFYKGYNEQNVEEKAAFSKEFEKLMTNATEQKVASRLQIDDVFNCTALKGIGIGVALTTFAQITAGFTIINYAVVIFDQAGTSFDPYMSSIVLGIALIFGSLLTTALADKLGRKRLNLISLSGSAFGLLAMSLYQYLYLNDFNLSSFAYIPVVCLSFITFISSVGIVPLANVCSVEYLPQKVRNLGVTIVAFASNAAAFISAKLFPTLMELVGLHGCMLIYGMGCVCATIFVYFVLIETKGTSLDDIAKNGGSKTQCDNSTRA